MQLLRVKRQAEAARTTSRALRQLLGVLPVRINCLHPTTRQPVQVTVLDLRLPEGKPGEAAVVYKDAQVLSAALGYLLLLVSCLSHITGAPQLHSGVYEGSTSFIWQPLSFWDAEPPASPAHLPMHVVPVQPSLFGHRQAYGMEEAEMQLREAQVSEGLQLLQRSIAAVTLHAAWESPVPLHLERSWSPVANLVALCDQLRQALYASGSGLDRGGPAEGAHRSRCGGPMAALPGGVRVAAGAALLWDAPAAGCGDGSRPQLSSSGFVSWLPSGATPGSPLLVSEDDPLSTLCSESPLCPSTVDNQDWDGEEEEVVDRDGWGWVRSKAYPPPPSQEDNVEQWTRAMITDAVADGRTSPAGGSASGSGSSTAGGASSPALPSSTVGAGPLQVLQGASGQMWRSAGQHAAAAAPVVDVVASGVSAFAQQMASWLAKPPSST